MEQPVLTVLLAEDDQDDREFFKDAAESLRHPISVTSVNDGEQLLNYLLQNTTNLPDIIFLDMNMPRKNGMECLVEIKKSVQFNLIPIVMYSTSLNEDIADRLYELGAHYYIRKQGLAELKKNIEGVLERVAESQLQPTRNHFIIQLQAV